VPVLLEVVVKPLSSIDVLIPNGNFLLVPLLHSVSDMIVSLIIYTSVSLFWKRLTLVCFLVSQ